MKRAVIYGAGNIGRGFIGQLFSQSGYEVTFIEVIAAVVAQLNCDHAYPVNIVSEEGNEEIIIRQVDAVETAGQFEQGRVALLTHRRDDLPDLGDRAFLGPEIPSQRVPQRREVFVFFSSYNL
ncbi:MAG: hypothetical protein SCM11_19765, partial [Bacillota bacterium]|nr:hypothetical protein [Bacillota bacterium]